MSSHPTDLCFLAARELAARIRRRDISPVEVVEAYLRRIEERNPTVNAYTLVLAEQATKAARDAEAAVMSGRPLGVLHGVPVAIRILTISLGPPVHGLARRAKSCPQGERSRRRKADQRGRNRSRQDQYPRIRP